VDQSLETIPVHKAISTSIHCKNSISGGLSLKDYIEERAVEIASYMIDTRATVRQTAKKFGVSKSTVHIDVTKEVEM
jgi:putative DeoR family transcriptional regulator (stage III sporulation protein D)